MSRTIRKYAKQGNTSKWAKEAANKAVRRASDLPMGRATKAYRKSYESWDICDQPNVRELPDAKAQKRKARQMRDRKTLRHMEVAEEE
jgi:hypothetical protein